jgi:hypothetical protein
MCADCSLTLENDIQFGAKCGDYLVGSGYCTGDNDCSGDRKGKCVKGACVCQSGWKCPQCDGDVNELISQPPSYQCSCALPQMNPEGGTICLGDDIEFGKARLGNTESVKYTVEAKYEDGRTGNIDGINLVTAGQRKAVTDILAPLGDTNGIGSFVMEVSGFSNAGGCNSNSGRSRFVAYELYDDSLVELGGMDILSIDVPTTTFAENIIRARDPQRVFFSPPFRPTVFRYTVKMDPGEQGNPPPP